MRKLILGIALVLAGATMAGAKDISALPEAVKKAEEILAGMLK